MKPFRSRRRKLLRALGIVAAMLVLAILLFPVWFPWVLAPVLRHYGIRFASYQSLGWTRFAVHGVRVDIGDVLIEGGRVEGPLPTTWLLARWRGDEAQSLKCFGADWRVRVIVEALGSTNAASTNLSTASVMEDVADILKELRHWLPSAQLTNGLVEVEGEQIRLPTVRWENGDFKATARSLRFTRNHLVEVHGDFSTNAPYTISARSESSGAEVRLELKPSGDNWELSGEGAWRSNRVALTSRFERQGWWPKEAQLLASSLQLPADRFDWEGYEDVTGTATLHWTGTAFDFNATASAKPRKDAPRNYPPIEMAVRAHGDPSSVFVEELKLTAPGVRADLSERVGIRRDGQLLTESAALKLSLDLARFPWLEMSGGLQGTVRLRPGATNQVRATFDLSGTRLSRGTIELKETKLAGEFLGPLLTVRRAEATFDDGSTFSGSGRFDLKAKSADDGEWKFRGRLPTGWLPASMAYGEMIISGEFNGPLSRLRHSGSLSATKVTMTPFDPCELKAEWRGAALSFTNLTADLRAGRSRLSLEGAVSLAGEVGVSHSVSLRQLTFERAGETQFTLKRPVEAMFQMGSGRAEEWTASLSSFEWSGTGREMVLGGRVEWPLRGEIAGRSRGVALDAFADFVRRPLPTSCVISNLDLAAKWAEGPVTFTLAGSGRMSTMDGTPFAAQTRIRGEKAGVQIERSVIAGTMGQVVSVEGTLPVEIVPASTNGWLRWNEKKSIDLRARTTPNEPFWDGVAAMTGARFSKPELSLAVSGTLAKPLGVLQAQAERVAWEPSTNRVTPPTLENLKADVEFQRDNMQLKALTVELEGQPVRARGELPLGRRFWTDLMAKGELPDWRAARGQLEIVDARLSLFARYLPDLLTPQGRLSLEVSLQPGAKLEGLLEITNAATRPLMPLGRVHDIEARVRFHDREARIETFRGELGGQPVRVTGQASLVEKDGLQFEVNLRGTNVPLVREAGVLVRSDLDMRLVQKNGQPTTVSGEATLRNGLFLQDLKALVPTGPTRHGRRPPYFSVEEEPFASWRLDMRIRGDRAMQVRTPLFRGDISAAMQLSGTLREPIALGEVNIVSGRMLFPFGTLDLDRGYVTVTSENPFRPSVFVTASGYTYGYSIKMEVTGPADEPRMTFTSTPPLTSEQIVLMLTAGEVPRTDFTLSDQQRVAGLGIFLGRDFLTRFLGSEGAAERLSVRSGEYMTDDGEQTYYLEYKLDKNWSVVGEYDRFNALNAGLKWKIFSK